MVSTIKISEFSTLNPSLATNQLAGVSSTSGGDNVIVSWPLIWTTSGRPTTPSTGIIGYNSSLGQYEYWNGAAWVQLASGGSGSVNVGSAKQLAYYATTGSAVSGLNTANNGLLVTGSSGVPSISSTAPAGITLPQPLIQGITNASNAAAGNYGEFMSSVIPFVSSIGILTNDPTDLTSLSLTAGDWNVWGNLHFTFSVSGLQTFAWCSLTSSLVPDQSLFNGANFTPSGQYGTSGVQTPMIRINVSAPATVYITGYVEITSGNCTMCGGIYARRVR